MTFKPAQLPLLQSLLDQTLARADRLDSLLAPLAGQSLDLLISAPSVALRLHFGHSTIKLAIPDEQLVVNATLHGSAQAFLRASLSDDPAKAFSNGDLELTGDSRLVSRFSKLPKQLNIDWEDWIAQFTGDIAARWLFSGSSKLFGWLGHSRQSLASSLVEYLQEESRDLPAGNEMRDFFARVDEIRDDVERSAARMQLLQQQVARLKNNQSSIEPHQTPGSNGE